MLSFINLEERKGIKRSSNGNILINEGEDIFPHLSLEKKLNGILCLSQ